jgi:ornithine racemase
LAYPEIVIDQAKLAHNTRIVCKKAAEQGIKISGVTKACLADEHVAKAMVMGGVAELADSRLENLHKLRALNLGIPLTLLRIPGLSQVKNTVELADTSLNSQHEVISALGTEARHLGKVHNVILMVDLGDLREGVLPKEVIPLAREINRIKGINLRGLGVNLACYGGVIPTGENLSQLVDLARIVEQGIGEQLEVISGGNSSGLGLLFRGQIPKGITNLRIGEGILLGRETINREIIENTYQDAFALRAEVVEVQVKPSRPHGIISQNAFGQVPDFEDRGPMVRAIVALGRQDVPAEGIYPMDSKLRILGASSDHLLIDASRKPGITVGDIVPFGLTYGGLLGAMTSPFVNKRKK